MARILVADDEADLELLIKQKFRKQIREAKYEFVFALNGVQALDRMKGSPDFDLVLTDINMPEMDGLTLLQKLGETFPLIKSVIVSAYGDMQNIRTAMNRGAFDFITKPVDFEDLEITIQKTLKHVEETKLTLKAIKENNILRMYVDENVLNFMGGQEFEQSLMRNEQITATVAFIDISGFTAITETQPADTVVKLLNNYFDLMVKEIVAQNGHVDKFIGDAIMAVFTGNYHLDRAIDAAIAIRAKIDTLPDLGWGYKPQVSIGINTGEMISGNIGAASLRRLDYTVVGDTVNLSQRLQSVAQPGQILIGAHAYETVKESFKCNPIGKVALKNKQAPVMVYEVIE